MKNQISLSEDLIVQKSFLFEKALYLFRSILIPENSPFALAIGALVFLNRQDDDFLKTLYEHLDDELVNLSNDPRDQPELENTLYKLLAYHGLCLKLGYEENIPIEILGVYLKFAENEEWLGSATLAILAKLFASDMQATSSISTTFSTNLKNLVTQGHLGNVCQVVTILNGEIAETERAIILERIKGEKISSHDDPWVILALNTFLRKDQNDQSNFEFRILLNEVIKKYIHQFEELITKGRDGLILEGIVNSSRLQKQTDLNLTQEDTVIEKVEFNDRKIVIILKDNPLFSIYSTELGLFLWTLISTGQDQIIGFRRDLEDVVKQTVRSQQKILEDETVLLDKNVLLLLNLFALLLVTMIGIGISLYYGDVTLDFSNTSFNSSSLLAASITLVFLLFGVFSLKKTGTIISLLFEIDIIKKIFNQIKEINKKD